MARSGRGSSETEPRADVLQRRLGRNVRWKRRLAARRRDPEERDAQFLRRPALRHRVADRDDARGLVAMVAQNAAERLDLGGGRPPHGPEEGREAALGDDQAQLLVRRAGHDMHVDLAPRGGEQRLRACDEGGSQHGAEHELRVALRQPLDALRVAGTAEQRALVVRELGAPRGAAMQVRVAHEFRDRGGILAGIDRRIGVELDAGGVRE